MNRFILFTAALFSMPTAAQSPWPSTSWNSATNITSVIASDGVAELSGLHWNPENNRLYVVKGDGRLFVLQHDATSTGFTLMANKSLPGGPEGITQVNLSANEFYVVDENNYEIRKYTHSASFGTVTLSRFWNLLQLPSPMSDTGNTGPEGIAFVPDAALTSAGFVSEATGLPYTSTKGMGGLLFIAHQDGGFIWVFDINPNVSNDFAYVGKYKTNRSESCDLSFDASTGLLYILHNTGDNYLEVTNLASTIISGQRKFTTTAEYFMPVTTENDNIEGFAVMPKCGTSSISAWVCRDAEAGDDTPETLQDAIRWFNPFAAPGTCPPLSADQFQVQGLAVYPNPATSEIAISMRSDEAEISIFSLDGKSVIKSRSYKSGAPINVSDLASGTYLIEVIQNGKTSVLKFVKR